jgi:nitronate monooxygenase
MEKPPKIATAFTKLFNLDYPIVAAPMFLISDAKLTTAVCRAGATGAFPALNFRPVEAFRAEVKKVKAATPAPFGVNIIVQETNKHRDEQIEICLDEGVAYLISSLGNPTSLIKRAHERGAKVFCDVVSEKHAQKAVDSGADGLIAVSSGAGGHAGDISAFALIPRLKSKFKVPVIAAGSIVDGRTMLAALALGADAVYLGTRFIASEEADAPSEYKDAIVRGSIDDIVNTDRVDGFPGNFIRNDTFDKFVPPPGIIEKGLRLSPKLDKTWRLYKASRTLFGKAKEQKASYRTVFSAGHGSGLIESVKPAQDIVYEIVSDYWRLKNLLP